MGERQSGTGSPARIACKAEISAKRVEKYHASHFRQVVYFRPVLLINLKDGTGREKVYFENTFGPAPILGISKFLARVGQ